MGAGPYFHLWAPSWHLSEHGVCQDISVLVLRGPLHKVSLFPLEHSRLTLLPMFPVGTRSLLASLPQSSCALLLWHNDLTLKVLPSRSYLSMLCGRPHSSSQRTLTGTHAAQERSGWRCSGPKVLLSQPWALPSGVRQGLGIWAWEDRLLPSTWLLWQVMTASFSLSHSMNSGQPLQVAWNRAT